MHRFFIIIILSVFLLPFHAKCETLPVRLHVVAEDDSAESQEIKLIVKNAVIQKARSIIRSAESESEAYSMLISTLDGIRACARNAAAECGFTGEIEVLAAREEFPARLYGNMLMKEGEYPSLIVKIGEGEGKNWWCVIYPDLCYYGEKTKEDEIRFYSKFGYWIQRFLDRWSK